MGAGAASLAHLLYPGVLNGQPPPAPADEPPAPPPDFPSPSPPPVAPRGDLFEIEQQTIALFENAAPSVVFITRVNLRADPFRRRVLEIPEGSGSGFVWDRQGHVVTNFHVIDGASGARVTLADGSIWPAALVGAVAEKDLAVLRIEAPEEQLRPIPVGASRELRVGQHVFAIGNPFGLDHTLSSGVVSGLEREIMSVGRRPIQGVIQTDAAINPGNSGGPLLDSAGRLIGVNTMIYSPSGASAGIGFAVPVDTVARAVPQLIAYGRVIRPVLGVRLADPSIAARLGLRGGALVLEVERGTPAEAARLRPTLADRFGRVTLGDVIVSVAGEDVADPNDIYRVLDRHEVGQTVEVGIVRGDERLTVPIQLVGVAAR
ncbi:MAG: trypsin-like peptidase domain-containing protein [Sandaracinaceae bacterium]|nr:trypsin-like peptidase domain-containing protein [Sandaracinaceae bacterium]